MSTVRIERRASNCGDESRGQVMHTHHLQGQWHPGEAAMHCLLGVPPQDNPTIPGLPSAYALWMARSPLLALGTVDRNDRIWTTVLGGRSGVIRPVAEGVMGLSSPAHLEPRGDADGAGWTGFDPVLEALLSDTNEDGAAGHGGERMFAALAMNLEERTRVKLAGRMLRGVVLPDAAKTPAPDSESRTRVDVQMALAVDETLGNCPKYLNSKVVWPHEASPRLVSDSLPLTDEAVELIGRSDIFFLSSRHGTESMDTNNRGGAQGFVRVFSNSVDEGVSLVYPEYSGNRLLQTLGNLQSDPAVGITFPDFETGNILYLTGRADILVGGAATTVLPHSRVAVKITVEAARFVSDGLPFRGRPLAPSPYNPPVHRLTRETHGTDALPDAVLGTDGRSAGIATATLVRSSRITPTVSRHTFRLSPDGLSPQAKERFSRLTPWQPGQHVTLDFSTHLDRGWSHMRDHDPTSLNDDYIRSFTISSAPLQPPEHVDVDRPGSLDGAEFDITVRRHGPVTHFLTRWVPGSELTVPVLEFAGEEDLRAPEEDPVVVAGGIGITPLMAHVGPRADHGRRLSVLWSLAADDLPLAIDLIERAGETQLDVTLFVTGAADASARSELQRLAQLGVDIHTRRIGRDDVLGAGTEGHRRFHVCAGPVLRKSLLGWLDGENVSVVNFDY
ncbi:pyridoxamine 5'-phosphate oxidase family protein [Promicromonospora sp. NPDC060204]|uniref:pyridoxamine 5'-phosphate oxidase family protein n=1 Tax=Promicromonospora sp. NPDC060204 TaxID=3347071 RepID=UPI0036553773